MENAALSSLRKKVLEYWPLAHWQRIENHYTPGVADVNVCLPGGREWWIEGKFLDHWPKKEDSPVDLNFRREQAMWLNARRRAGGNAILALKVGTKEWLFFNSKFLEISSGQFTQSEIVSFCYVNCHSKLTIIDLEHIFYHTLCHTEPI
jgi:hypothetical protein